MEKMGLRIRGLVKVGTESRISWSAPELSQWFPTVADLFRECFWVADNFDSTTFNGLVWDYSRETFENLVVEWQPNQNSSSPILFKPESMNIYYPYVHNDWICLYGIQAAQIKQVLARWHDDKIEDYLLQIADPFIRNADGGWWDIFTIHIETVRKRLASIENIKLVEVAISDWH